ncbi:MAG: hypothetical protein QXR97_03960 [Thermoproteota archaeon]
MKHLLRKLLLKCSGTIFEGAANFRGYGFKDDEVMRELSMADLRKVYRVR